jgi:hypothetical protein
MYSFLLFLHSILRWIVLFVGIFAIVRAFRGWFGKKVWTEREAQVGLAFTASVDVQVVVGLLLYLFFSPITTGAFSDFGAAMSDSGTRYFLVEHSLMMLAALVLAHVGRARAKKAATDEGKYRASAIFYSLALLLILLGIPWFRALWPWVS